MNAPLAMLLALGCRETLVSHGHPRGAGPAWEATLERIVQPDGTVDYDALEADRSGLDDYVAWIASGQEMRGKKKADHHDFWLNAYNALVIFQVLERGRPASVMDVDGWLPVPGSGFFLETQFQVGVDALSLSEIEHERVRMKELNYRDHAALNCASLGCPPLRPELYVKERLKEQLTEQMDLWMADREKGVRVEDGVAVFSPIFDWYAFDFEFTSGGLNPCEIAAQHTVGPIRDELAALGRTGCPHRFMGYDWRLNDARSTPAGP